MDLRRLLISHQASTKRPFPLLPSRSKHSFLPLKVISESPVEDAGQVELRMRNRKLVLVGEGTHLSLSDFINRQFSPRPRPSLLEPIEVKRRLVHTSRASHRRIRVS
jgi:hypothetical protein